MPNSKSSTSSDALRRSYLEKRAAEGDYQTLLYDLLAVIHRDGGHYTALAGLAVSVEDAMELVCVTRSELLELKRKERKRNE